MPNVCSWRKRKVCKWHRGLTQGYDRDPSACDRASTQLSFLSGERLFNRLICIHRRAGCHELRERIGAERFA
jgi:hypothetical protein